MSRISRLLGKLPISVKHSLFVSGDFGNKLYRLPSSVLSVITSNGYMFLISELFLSKSSNGIKTLTLAFGTPKPLFTVTLPTITP